MLILGVPAVLALAFNAGGGLNGNSLNEPRLLEVDLGGGKSVGVVAAWPVWAASLALARVVAHCPSMVAGKRVLSLECGLGSVGLAAADAGASEVLLTDEDPLILEYAKQSGQASRSSHSISTMLLDPAVPATYKPLLQRAEPFDVILAADVLHDVTAPYLLSVLLARLLLEPEAACFVADPLKRSRRQQFAEACKNAGLAVREAPLPSPDAIRLLCVQRAPSHAENFEPVSLAPLFPSSGSAASIRASAERRPVPLGEQSELCYVDLGGGKSAGVVAAWPVWEASVALAGVIANCPSIARGKRVLELRSGLGAVGLAAAGAGATEVLLTDVDEDTLQYATTSATLTGLGDAISTAFIDYTVPGTYQHLLARAEPFDVILAADVLHEPTAPYMVSALLDAVLVTPGAVCLISDPEQRGNRALFALACRNAGLVLNEGPLPSPNPKKPMRLLCIERGSPAEE